MNTKKITILILLFSTYFSYIFGCTCERHYFCEYIKEGDERIAFRATVIQHKEYSLQNQAVYLEIINFYRDDIGITDTIKLYGGESEAQCGVNVNSRLKLGADLLIAIRTTWNDIDLGFDFSNPDSLLENYWEFAPNLCNIIILKIENDKIFGNISKEENIQEYPFELFDERLENCDFSQDELVRSKCSADDFILFPNPSPDGIVSVRGSYKYTAISQIHVFTMDGKLINQYEYSLPDIWQKIEIRELHNGLLILEIVCNERKYYKKLIIEK